jgi:hypothetical protein
MPVPTPKLSLLLTLAALGVAAPGCGTDDAVERDAKDAAEEVEKSNVDEKAGEAAEDAGREAEKAGRDVDGQ